MLKDAYLLAKIGADKAENEQLRAEILTPNRDAARSGTSSSTAGSGSSGAPPRRGRNRARGNNSLLAKFAKLVKNSI